MTVSPIVVPPNWFPPAPYFVFGRQSDDGVVYSVHRPHPAASVPLVFREGADWPEDFPAHFKKCLGEEPAP